MTNQKSKDWYNNNAEEYSKHTGDKEDSVYHSYYEKPAMKKLIPNITGKNVLSLGCGAGYDTNYLQELGAGKSVGIDISVKLIEIAKAKFSNCQFYVMDMEKLKFLDNSFDFIYSSLAIHYLENWEKVLKEMYRILKPGGNVLFSCNHPLADAFVQTENNDEFKLREIHLKKFKKTGEYEIVGDYLSRKLLTDSLGKNTVDNWSKPITEISEEIFNSGFLIERILEPKPLEELKDIQNGTYQKLSKFPWFIIFKLSKK